MADLTLLRQRAEDRCELCGATDELDALAVPPHTDLEPEHAVYACARCRGEITGDGAPDAKHWYCLQTSIWSEAAPVQVVSYRMARRVDETWARELLEQVYLSEEVEAWVGDDEPADEDDRPPAFDSNGARLHDGDSVTLIKDLDVKGTSFVAKRGTLVRGIRLTNDPGLIEGKVNKVQIYLKTEFLKRA